MLPSLVPPLLSLSCPRHGMARSAAYMVAAGHETISIRDHHVRVFAMAKVLLAVRLSCVQFTEPPLVLRLALVRSLA